MTFDIRMDNFTRFEQLLLKALHSWHAQQQSHRANINKSYIAWKWLSVSSCTYTSPDFYEVHPCIDLETDMDHVVHSLKQHKSRAPRVLVYCCPLDTCAILYAHFLYELGDDSYHSSGADKVCENRLFSMYQANTPDHNKEVILKSLGVKSLRMWSIVILCARYSLISSQNNTAVQIWEDDTWRHT